MGNCDSFMLREPTWCPQCKKRSLQEFQACEFGGISVFNEGERAETDNFILKDGTYDVYSVCFDCDTLIEAKILVTNHVFIGLTSIQIAPP